MSNAPILPEVAPPPPPVHDEERTPVSGVRKMLDAFEERDLSRIRWSSVLAGLFLALGVSFLLGLFGLAVGLSVSLPGELEPRDRLAAGLLIWMGFSSLVSLFVGSYAAAKLGGSIRRGDGALSGALMWSVSVALGLLALGAGGPMVWGASARAAWAALAAGIVSLLAAASGGALGAVGRRKGERLRTPAPYPVDE